MDSHGVCDDVAVYFNNTYFRGFLLCICKDRGFTLTTHDLGASIFLFQRITNQFLRRWGVYFNITCFRGVRRCFWGWGGYQSSHGICDDVVVYFNNTCFRGFLLSICKNGGFTLTTPVLEASIFLFQILTKQYLRGWGVYFNITCFRGVRSCFSGWGVGTAENFFTCDIFQSFFKGRNCFSRVNTENFSLVVSSFK